MRPLVGLTWDIYSYMFMAYESCRRRSKSRASQSGVGTTPTRGGPGSRGEIGSALQHFQAPGLPLSPNGTRNDGADADQRCQDPVHSKAFAELGSAAPPVRHHNWADAQRDRQPRLNDGPTSRAGAWLKAARARNLRLEYRFDRLFEEKLAQVFQALAPAKLGIIGAAAETKEAMNDKARSHLRASVIGLDRRRTTRSRARRQR